ncbi:S-layer homology domain-containing protein [Veillonella rodentium]|uniref:Endo-1,4-beta-xylanase A n=1 Tax=Veillonella rodentium TaxID=248315 RepID=A0A239ZVF0_9FIRM|nr:S-layer homology domain-containing protein [Veillonella rodentium]SNV74784.1 Endo-1,4-beta-xylanase A precursor [Veillonella rodentium]
MNKNTKYTLHALVLGALVATTGLTAANTTSTAATANTVPSTARAATQSAHAAAATDKSAITNAKSPLPSAATNSQTALETRESRTESNPQRPTNNDLSTETQTSVVNQQLPVGGPADIQNVRPYIFSDVPSDFWAANSISTVTRANLMKGYSDGTFRPNQPMTREEVASLFNNITNDGQAAFLSSKFKDITSDRWSALAIESVARKNIISGYGDDTYKPEKYMSRQEFAVVADNYIHYLGYTTEDPTVLDTVAYGDQKFVAPWAQDAVRELAYLGFTNYAPGTLFNPEKYITRAEAAEITYRMTQTEQALAFHNTLFRQQVENKTVRIIDNALNYGNDFTKFRNDGALFWEAGQLYASLTDQKKVDLVAKAIADAHDLQLDKTVVVSKGKLTQVQLEDYQSDAIALYQEKEPKGKIISIYPNTDTSALIITVDSIQKSTMKAFKKKFHDNVFLQLPPEPLTGGSDGNIHFPLPQRNTKK